MYRVTTFFLAIIIVLIPKLHFSTIITSNGIGGGDWDTSSSWIPSGVPVCVDTISILAGDIITISSQQDYEACPPMLIIISGTLLFPDNGPKFKLPCGSSILVMPGGLISGPGDDNSNKISICTEWVWESKDDDVTGPYLIGSPPLPITLESFEAEIDNTSVKLLWTTSAEINNDYFSIERSENGLDFELLSEIPGNGNSNVSISYDYFDDSPLMGTSYYRLKQTDFDGKYEYVDLLAVNFNQDDDGICMLHVYPNPCVGSCSIDLKDCPLANNQVDIELYDAFGKKVVSRISPKSSNKDISFHLNSSNNLAPGVYIVRASINGKKQSSKVVVK